jgi:pimeloyl-ACP methyl ester carboxylesterase
MNKSASKTLVQLRGAARLGFDATQGVVGVVEQMHRTISDRAWPLAPGREPRTTGLTGAVYRAIRGTTAVIGSGVDQALRLLETRVPGGANSLQREALLAAVNGIWGDHLAATGNPLAIAMALRIGGQAVPIHAEGLRAAVPAPTGRVAVLVHGLCMNDLQWHRLGHHHGEMMARELGCTVLDLHYNTGLSVADNGAQFAQLLTDLLVAWPVPVDELVLVGHSMGGLVARSAIDHADAQARQQGPAPLWRQKLKHLVCLGTPHEGAALERGGRLIDAGLELSPYLAPFARLGKARSTGINNLHDGSVRAALPSGVHVGLLAATTTAEPKGLRHALMGDGLVTVASAWGEHPDPARALHLPASRKRLITQANHWDLLSHPQAADALRAWLG